MTDPLLILAALVVGGAFIAWLANIFTVPIPHVAKQLYLMLIISFIVYVVITFLRTA